MFRLLYQGVNLILADNLDAAVDVFAAAGQENSPFRFFGLGVCAVMKAALNVEPEHKEGSLKCLTLAKQAAGKYRKLAKSSTSSYRFQSGIEWEVFYTDIIVVLRATHVIFGPSGFFKGYLRCCYHFFSAYLKYSKLFKTLYPQGLDAYATPSQAPPASSHEPPEGSLRYAEATPVAPVRMSRFFARWIGLGGLTTPTPALGAVTCPTQGHVEEFISSGMAFGYGLSTLFLSLLPTKWRNVARSLGYSCDRQLGLKALAVSATHTDMHGVVAGYLTIVYYSVLLHASGYQANEKHIMDEYRGILRTLQSHSKGPVWVLYQAKIQRMTGDPEGAVVTLREDLQGDRKRSLQQFVTMLAVELAWTLLQCRRYEESARAFMAITKNHPECHFFAAGCYVSVGRLDKAQPILDALPKILGTRKSGNVPMDVFVETKLTFYKKKHIRRGGDPNRYAEAMKINPAEEFALAWNVHAYTDKETALAHVEELTGLTPSVNTQTEYIMPSPSSCQPGQLLDLDTPDELAVRSLILGVLHRTLGDYTGARKLLHDSLKHYGNADANNSVGGMSHFELAVLDMKEGEWRSAMMSEDPAEGGNVLEMWKLAIQSAKVSLARAHALCKGEMVMSSRLDSRISMLHEEIDTKMKQLRILGM